MERCPRRLFILSGLLIGGVVIAGVISYSSAVFNNTAALSHSIAVSNHTQALPYSSAVLNHTKAFSSLGLGPGPAQAQSSPGPTANALAQAQLAPRPWPSPRPRPRPAQAQKGSGPAGAHAQEVPFESRGQSGGGLSIAVCITGHIRTFPLKGMYSSLAAHLFGPTCVESVDVFFVGVNGSWHPPRHQHFSHTYIAGPFDDKLVVALELFRAEKIIPQGFGVWDLQSRQQGLTGRLHLKHVEILREARCAELESAWERYNVTGRTCWEDPAFYQLNWIEHCFGLARRSGVHYDFVVRSRPDIVVLEPLPWHTISKKKVTVVPKFSTFGDWFFIVPHGMLSLWWDHVVSFYQTVGHRHGVNGIGKKGLEWTIFQPARPNLNRTLWTFGGALPRGETPTRYFQLLQHPIFLVRSSSKANCEWAARFQPRCVQWVRSNGADRLVKTPKPCSPL